MNNKKAFTVVGLIAVNLIALTVFLAQARAAVTVYADEPASNAAAMAIPSDPVKVIAIVSPFIMVVAIIALAGYFGHRRNKMTHETLRAMIDKGVPITPELVAELRSKHAPGVMQGRMRGGGLFPGLVLAGIGTAVLITDSGHGAGGWIVLFIGVAFLVVWLVERQNRNNAEPPKP